MIFLLKSRIIKQNKEGKKEKWNEEKEKEEERRLKKQNIGYAKLVFGVGLKI